MKHDFQPMPKRFMAWDTLYKKWLVAFGYEGENYYDLVYQLARIGILGRKYIIVQSTNLFDKGGKEIFEGSIVKGKVSDDPKTRIFGVVIYRQQAFWIVNAEETHKEPLLKFCERELENIGHILSEPELLEKRDV